MVCLNQPVQDFAGAAGEVDSLGQGIILSELGGNGGISLIGPGANQILFNNGFASVTNPYGATPGIVCARFGWGTQADDYLRVRDTRDPQFRLPLIWAAGRSPSNGGGYGGPGF